MTNLGILQHQETMGNVELGDGVLSTSVYNNPAGPAGSWSGDHFHPVTQKVRGGSHLRKDHREGLDLQRSPRGLFVQAHLEWRIVLS